MRIHFNILSPYSQVANWTAFKQHLASVEKEYGELVAFPTTMTADRLPNESNYLPKFRNYGDNQRYLSSDIQVGILPGI